ncbi:hypothetical protein ASZ90_016353 [hydrocarbon metagenome]|uniref:Uncharacterized protein n=1 Tax=hydrocarbon metagenome TaxID=938273 RepID=A0A0W8EYC6_9ZZZZ
MHPADRPPGPHTPGAGHFQRMARHNGVPGAEISGAVLPDPEDRDNGVQDIRKR